MKHIPNREEKEEMTPEEIEGRRIVGEWFDSMTPKEQREAFIGFVVIHEMEVMGHIKETIKKSKDLDTKIKESKRLLKLLNDKSSFDGI